MDITIWKLPFKEKLFETNKFSTVKFHPDIFIHSVEVCLNSVNITLVEGNYSIFPKFGHLHIYRE
jgi:hypothetical protein